MRYRKRDPGVGRSSVNMYTSMKTACKHPSRRPGHRRGNSDDRGYNYSGDVFQVNLCHSRRVCCHMYLYIHLVE